MTLFTLLHSQLCCVLCHFEQAVKRLGKKHGDRELEHDPVSLQTNRGIGND